MQTAPLLDALRREIAAATASGDAATTAVVERLAASLEAAAHLWLLDAATEAAAGLNAQLPSGHVEVRLAGRDPDLVYVPEPEREADPAPAGEEYAARITLRLPDVLKAQVEAAAAADGLSVNTWLVRTIARGSALRASRRSTGRRLTGYGQS